VNCFAEWDHSLTHIPQLPHDEQILAKETWAVVLCAAEAVVALFTAGLIFARKKFYLTLIGKAALVSIFFVYLLFLFISKPVRSCFRADFFALFSVYSLQNPLICVTL